MYLSSTLPLWLLVSFKLTCSSPIQSLSTRQLDVDCYDKAAVFCSDCWAILGISEYLDHEGTGWNQTTPVCSDSTRCCIQGEPWSTCFLRLGRGLSGADCTSVNDQTCTWDNQISPYLDPSIEAKVRYVVKSIYGVHDFFSSYFKALQYATTQASLMIAPLTNAIDPNSDTNLGITVIMFVLSFGLSFLTAPTVAFSLLQMTTALKYSAQNFALSMQQAPAVARTMWPTGSDSSRMFQISQLSSQLDNATSELSEILDRGLKLLMEDVPTFVSYAQTGAYCGNETIDIAAKTDDLDLALRTYITSESMKQNGWYAVPLRISTQQEYQALVDAAPTAMGWREGPEVVNKIYWSPASGRQYSLEHSGGNTIEPSDLRSQIESQGWADMVTLFDGSYTCTARGNAGSADLINVNFDGTLNTDCISRLPIYVPCGANCPEKLADGSCPFGFKENCDSMWSMPGLPPDRQQPGFVNPPP